MYIQRTSGQLLVSMALFQRNSELPITQTSHRRPDMFYPHSAATKPSMLNSSSTTFVKWKKSSIQLCSSKYTIVVDKNYIDPNKKKQWSK